MTAESEFEKLVKIIGASHDGQSGQMFGKKCIKVNGKAAIALYKECLVFKLTDPEHSEAINLNGSELWDPSGKGRAMKEWVQVGLAHKSKFKAYGVAASNYVS